MTDKSPTQPMELEALREQLAAIEHERWSDWQRWVHSLMGEMQQAGKGTGLMAISKKYVDRWQHQIATPYAELSEREKASDMEQVDRYWPLIEQYIQSRLTAHAEAFKKEKAQIYTDIMALLPEKKVWTNPLPPAQDTRDFVNGHNYAIDLVTKAVTAYFKGE